jgi:hypothetical protein
VPGVVVGLSTRYFGERGTEVVVSKRALVVVTSVGSMDRLESAARWASVVVAACAILSGALASPAAAKDLCLRTTEPGPDPYVYVLKRVKLKPGAFGPVSGYLTAIEGANETFPLSGSYGVSGGSAYFTLVLGASSSGYGYDYAIHNFGIDLDGSGGTVYATRHSQGGVEVESSGTTEPVDCKTVPDFPKP